MFIHTRLVIALTLVLAASACNQSGAASATNPASSALTASGVTAQNASAAVEDSLKTALTQKFETAFKEKNIKVQEVNATPVAGLYQLVVTGNQVIYADKDVNYVVIGDFIDLKNKTNLTEAAVQKSMHVDYKTLPLDKAIKEVRGNGKLKMAVFSDPDCPYCQQLEHELAQMTDITVYTFLMPITSLHPDAANKAEQIWCQADRTAVWTKWMREKTPIPKAAPCANPVAETTALGNKLGFTGTPTLVFPNGRVQPGFMPNAALKTTLEQNQ